MIACAREHLNHCGPRLKQQLLSPGEQQTSTETIKIIPTQAF